MGASINEDINRDWPSIFGFQFDLGLEFYTIEVENLFLSLLLDWSYWSDRSLVGVSPTGTKGAGRHCQSKFHGKIKYSQVKMLLRYPPIILAL
jgi:hypothetical protein